MEELARALLKYFQYWRKVYRGNVIEPATDRLYTFTIEDWRSGKVIFKRVIKPERWLEL